MRILFDSTTVTTATTRVQIGNTAAPVKWIQFKARAANTGRIFVGLSDVALAKGWELPIPLVGRPNDPLTLDFKSAGTKKDGSVLLSQFWADSTVNGEIVDWVAIVT
jgi:hypothetical protein